MPTPKPLKHLEEITRRDTLAITFLFLCWRLGLFLVGYFADYFLTYRPSFPYADSILAMYDLPRWFYSWANFDGVHYITIAEKGYIGTGLIQAFFPMYPFVILHTLFLLIGRHMNTIFVGMFISNFAAFLAFLVWFGFLAHEKGKAKAWIGLALVMFFPTALFWGALYTESLFFAVVIGSFWASRTQRWGVAMICALIATATRVVGIFLIPALIIELWLQWRDEKHLSLTIHFKTFITQSLLFLQEKWRTIVLLCLGSLGLFAYMAYLQYAFHDPLYFLHVQSQFGAGRQEHFISYPQVLWRSLKILLTLRPFDLRYYTAILEFLAGTVGFIGVIAGYRKVRLSYLFFGLGAFFLPTFTGTFSSMPRYLLVCFPIYFLLIELLAERRWLRTLVLTLFWLSLCLNVMVFVQGYWLS